MMVSYFRAGIDVNMKVVFLFIAVAFSLLLCPGIALSQPVVAAPVSAAVAGDERYSDDMVADLYADEDGVEVVNDPLQSVNRCLFWFNDKCYFYVFKPLARGFRVVPQPVRNGLRNVFDNLRAPRDTINALLQLKGKRAATQFTRLLVNSTIGVLGFFDVAESCWSLERKEEDFGQTLAFYGVGEGFYVVLPFLGASTLRDGFSLVPDGYADPVYWLSDYPTTLASKGVKTINTLSLDKDNYESIVEEQLDPYLFVRDAYIQNRRFDVGD